MDSRFSISPFQSCFTIEGKYVIPKQWVNSHMFELVKQAGMLIYHLWISLRWRTTEKQPRGTWIFHRLTFYLFFFFFHEILLLTMNLKASAVGMLHWPDGGHGAQLSPCLRLLTIVWRDRITTGVPPATSVVLLGLDFSCLLSFLFCFVFFLVHFK